MKTKRRARKRYSETGSEPSQRPENFICVDPSRMSFVFDFLKDFKQDVRDTALMHLRLCLHCREVAATLLKVNRSLGTKSQSPRTEKSEMADEDHHGTHATTEDCKAECYSNVGE